MKCRPIALLFTLAGLVLIMAMGGLAVFRMYENKTVDSRFYWRHRLRGPSPSPAIRIIGIDDQTLQALGGQWPISLRWHALLLQSLTERLPAVVAYDILFQAVREEDRGEERKLVQATRMLGDVLYPYYFTFAETGEGVSSPYKTPGELNGERRALEKYRLPSVVGNIGSLPSAMECTLPIAPLAESAALGFANAPGDEGDGVVRRMPLILRYGDGIYPSFALMAALRYHNVDLRDVRVSLGKFVGFPLSDGSRVSIPIDAAGSMEINYTSIHNEFENFLFVQVVQSFALKRQGKSCPVDLADFEGKIVLVGPTASGVVEAYTKPTPLSPDSPLLTVHANAIATILSGTFPRAVGFWSTALILLVLGLAISAVTSALRAVSSLILSAGCLAGYTLAAYALFFSHAVILPLVPGFAMVALVYTLVTSYRYATEERQRRFYRGVLGKYLSRNVMEALLSDPSSLKLGGERKEMTVLFADVKGFTKFCEGRPVEEIASRLNELHDLLTRIIWKHDGTLDKYMGDGLMAFWGAPLDQPDHAGKAILAAVEMTEEVERLRTERMDRGQGSFSIGVGINTGTMVVGNMGASDFWDYTVLGDEVNLGSRLEGLTRSHRADVIISEATRDLVADRVEARHLGEVTVKGREKPVVIYGVNLPPQDFKTTSSAVN